MNKIFVILHIFRHWGILEKIKKRPQKTQKTCRQTHDRHLNLFFENDKSDKKMVIYIYKK